MMILWTTKEWQCETYVWSFDCCLGYNDDNSSNYPISTHNAEKNKKLLNLMPPNHLRNWSLRTHPSWKRPGQKTERIQRHNAVINMVVEAIAVGGGVVLFRIIVRVAVMILWRAKEWWCESCVAVHQSSMAIMLILNQRNDLQSW